MKSDTEIALQLPKVVLKLEEEDDFGVAFCFRFLTSNVLLNETTLKQES